MKANRPVVMGFRSVGNAADHGTFLEGPLGDQIKIFLQWLLKQEMRKRVDLVIGRDLRTVKNRILDNVVLDSRMATGNLFETVEDIIAGKTGDEIVESKTLEIDPEDDWSN